MSNKRPIVRRRLPYLFLAGVLLAASQARPADDVKLAEDAPGPLTPEQSRQLFAVPAGFRVELVASEPHLADPVAMAFDARGRILVCEIHGYNLEGYYDVLELNKSGGLDRQVRRILANDEAIRRAALDQYGTVKRLEDTDGDGKFDRSFVLADRLPPCYGLVPARDGVIVLCAPDIIYLADRDDDGVAEVRETLFTGFGVGEMWTRINNPRWGIDNWIYAVSGQGSGGVIRGPHLREPVRLGSVCFRFRADGSALQAASGTTHGFGQAIDDWGQRFLCTNQQHALHVIPIPDRYLARNPFYAAPNLTVDISSYGHPARVYPISLPDPWRRARAADPEWVKFYGAMEATANGYFTAASGQTIYAAAAYPAEFRGNHFSVDNAQNLIHRCLLIPDGVSFRAERPQRDERSEFLTSSEQWFRPVNMLTGPDGMLYVVDMYRDVIEDYSAIPRYLQQLYVRSLIAGAQRGRIWRIVAGEDSSGQQVDLTAETGSQLALRLSDDNAWRRLTAQRLLVERQDRSVVPRLEKLAADGPAPLPRMHALYTLEGLGSLSPSLVVSALGDASPEVRVHAMQLAEQWLVRREVLECVMRLGNDSDVRVRLQCALTLGESSAPDVITALARLAVRQDQDRWIEAAIVSSSAAIADQLLVALLTADGTASPRRTLVQSLAEVVGAQHDPSRIAGLLSTLGQLPAQAGASFGVTCLTGLAVGLDRGRATTYDAPEMVDAIRGLMVHADRDVRKLTLRVASKLKVDQTAEMKAILQEAREQACDEECAVAERIESVALLSRCAVPGSAIGRE